MGRRREPRVEMNVEVKVWGLDRYGKPFVQHARTVDATRLGARLLGVDCVKVGEVIGVQNGEHKARFKVVWMGRENTPKAGQVGLHCLEPDTPIFTTKSSELELPRIPAHGFGLEAARKVHPVRRDMPASRRKHPRYLCTGGVELRQQEGGKPAWGNLNDVSLTGCYVEATTTMPVGTMVLFQLHARDLNINGRAIIKTSHHAVGMGLAFLHLGTEDQHNLEFLIGTLAGQQEMLPEERRTFVPADEPPPAIAAATAAFEAVAESGEESSISAHIMRAVTELNELEQNLVRDKVDPRLIAQFHDATEHARQTAWTVQQWVDLRAGGSDPFQVLPQLEAERMHMLMKLAHNVVADIDSSGINEYSEGIAELYETVQQLHKRLKKVLIGDTEDEDDEQKTFRARR
jgi:PilZ domain-containing protein